MRTAFLFPGQASQKVGMGLGLYNESEIGKKYFNIADEIMGLKLSKIIFEGPEEQLKQTQFTQPAIYVVSVILGKLLLENGAKPVAAAGHSLGEYSALASTELAVEALEKIGDIRVVEPLIKVIEELGGEVCKITVEALGNMGDTRAVEPLIKALGGWDVEICGISLRTSFRAGG